MKILNISKKEKVKYSCYFVTLKEVLIGLNLHFCQAVLNIIFADENLLNLTIIDNDYTFLSKTIDNSIDVLNN